MLHFHGMIWVGGLQSHGSEAPTTKATRLWESTLESTRCTIIHSNEDHLVVTMGLEGMLVVHTPDATLVADRNHEEAIRRVVAELENRGWSEFL